MNDTPANPSDREQRLQDVLAGYMQAAEAGQTPERRKLLAEHPDLADELASLFADREEFADMTGPMAKLAPPASEAATVGAAGPTVAVPAVGDNVRYFGDYEILEEIARGGMGVVFKARQVSLNRVVALKMILAGQLATPQDVQRFKHEAEAAANLDHPNIVSIYEVNEHAGSNYFSMKLVEGGSLAGRVEDLRKDRKTAVQLMVQVARAVHYAHQRGILHRDLKPANILLDNEGQPHITDFGLAKKTTGDSGMTQSGAIVGTPSYMAPEQAAAKKDLTTAVDVYSLGAILYELLTGQPPFRGSTPLDTLLQVLEQEPLAPRAVDPHIDRDLEAVCLKCLRKDPGTRYGSADALADDLNRWLAGEPTAARPPSPWGLVWLWLRRNVAAAAWTAAVGMMCGLLISLVLWCSDILPRLHGLAFAYDRLPHVRRPWLMPDWQAPPWAQYALIIVAVTGIGGAGLLIAALARTRDRAADVAAGLAAGLLMALGCFLFGGAWSYLISAAVTPTAEDQWLLTEAGWGAGERPGWEPAERLLEKYPDLRVLAPWERMRVMQAKIEADTILGLGDGLTFISILMLGFTTPFMTGATVAAGSLLRGRGGLIRVVVPYCEATVPTAFLLFVFLILLAKVQLGEELGALPLLFLCVVPIIPAVAGAMRGWHWAVRAGLQIAWVVLFATITYAVTAG